MYPWSEFWLSILILKVQRTSMSFKSSFGALEDAGGSWLGFGILILIWICSLVFDTTMIWILALCPDFEGTKNIDVLEVLIWGSEGCMRFLSGVWNLNLEFGIFTGLWYTNLPNFGSLSWFWWHQEHICLQSPEHGYIKNQWQYPNQDQEAKPPSRTSSNIKSPKSRPKGHGCSLHLQNQDIEPNFLTWVYQRPVTISKSRSGCKTSF